MAEFFTEVDEDVRRARALSAARRYGPFVLLALFLALVVALGWWAVQSVEAGRRAKASLAYDAALQSLSRGQLDAADKGFGAVAASAPSGYAALALMQQAGVRLLRHRNAEAAALLDQAAKRSHAPLIADAAALEAALALMDTAPLTQTEARLDPLSKPGRPYRDMAREASALAKLAAGQAAAARTQLATLSLQPDVSEGARARARAAIAMIDSGAAANLPAALKAERALPPPPVGLPPAALAARSAP